MFWLLNDFHLKLKNIIWPFLKAYFHCFAKGPIHNVVLTLPNVVKPDVENNNVVSTLSDVVHIDVEIHNVDSTLFNVVNFDVEVHNVVSTLIWGCSTSRRRINLKQCWTDVEMFAGLEVSSKNLIGKKPFRTQALMKRLIFSIELFLIFLVALFHMK